MDFSLLLADIGLLLGACLIIGAIFIRFGQSPITAYLIAGMVLAGPGSFQLIRSTLAIETISEIGVSLLLFSLGLEFSWQRLQSFQKSTIQASVLQVLVTPVVLGSVFLIFGSTFETASTLGFMLTLSSTACVLRILYDRAEIDSAHGRNSLAILLSQDIAVVPFAIAVSLVGANQSMSEVFAKMGSTILYISFLIIGLYLTINVIAVRLLSVFTRKQNREMMPLLTVLIGVGASLAAHEMELSPAIGAFVAGIILAGSPFATQVRADVASFRVVFLTLFFGAIGMSADLTWIAENLFLVIGMSALVIIGKSVTITVIMRMCRHPLSTAVATGLALGQIGEFAFVLGKMGEQVGALTEWHSNVVTSVALVSLMLTPPLVALAPKAGRKIDEVLSKKKKPRDLEEGRPEQNAIFILGLGPAGQESARRLAKMGEKIIAIDLNKDAVLTAREIGIEFHVGNGEQHEVLEHFGIEHAKMVIVALPGRTSAENAVRAIRESNPTAIIIARSRYKNSEGSILSAGAHHTVCDEIEVSKVLAEQAVQFLNNDYPKSESA